MPSPIQVAEQILELSRLRFITELTLNNHLSTLGGQVTKVKIRSWLEQMHAIARAVTEAMPEHLLFAYSLDEKGNKVPPQYLLDLAVVIVARIAAHAEATAAAYCWALTESIIIDGPVKENIEFVAVYNGKKWLHSLLLLGRHPSTDITDPRTWNAEAVVCDTTLDKWYLARELLSTTSPLPQVVISQGKYHFEVKMSHCGELTAADSVSNNSLSAALQNIIFKINATPSFAKMIVKNDFMALSKLFCQMHHGANPSYQSTLETNLHKADQHGLHVWMARTLLSTKKFPSSEVVSYAESRCTLTSEGLRVLISALYGLTHDIVDKQWRLDLRKNIVQLHCNNTVELNTILRLIAMSTVINAKTTVDPDPNKFIVTISPLPKVEEIESLMQKKLASGGIYAAVRTA